MTKERQRNSSTLFALLLVSTLLLTACGTFEVGIERTALPGITAIPTTESISLPTPDTSGWNTYSNPTYAVSFQYPPDWQLAGDDRYIGEEGVFGMNALGGPEATVDDIAASEAGHTLQPYGSQPIIENLQIQGQEARLILPSADATMNGLAALVVRYPQPVKLGDTYQFFVLYAGQDHIRTIAQTLRFSAAPPPTGTATLTPPIAWKNLPPGLVYKSGGALWLINGDEQPVQIHNNAQAVISPDGAQLLSYDSNQQDVWLINRTDGAISNLTRTPNRVETHLRWWPGRPGVVLFQSSEDDADLGSGMKYYLTAVNIDGQSYQILDAEHDTNTLSGPGQFAPSPDGQTIAYSSDGAGWLYRWGTGIEAFDPAGYGLSGEGVQIAQPAWSPDGARLAWIVKGDVAADGSSVWTGIGLFDLTTRTAQVLHPYESQGVGWPSAPVWSPDGQWLAFGDGSPSDDAGLWVARTDGQQEEHHLGLGGNPVWSPDGKWLAFQGAQQDGLPAYLLAEVGTWELRPLDAPLDRYGMLVDWISP